VRKFFSTINHSTLLSILVKRIKDEDTINLLKEIIASYEDGTRIREREREREREKRRSAPAYL